MNQATITASQALWLGHILSWEFWAATGEGTNAPDKLSFIHVCACLSVLGLWRTVTCRETAAMFPKQVSCSWLDVEVASALILSEGWEHGTAVKLLVRAAWLECMVPIPAPLLQIQLPGNTHPRGQHVMA